MSICLINLLIAYPKNKDSPIALLMTIFYSFLRTYLSPTRVTEIPMLEVLTPQPLTFLWLIVRVVLPK